MDRPYEVIHHWLVRWVSEPSSQLPLQKMLIPYENIYEIKDGDVYNCFQQYKHDYVTWIYHITMISHEGHCVSSHQLINCCFNSLLRSTTFRTWKSASLALCEGSQPVTGLLVYQSMIVSCIFHKSSNSDGNKYGMTGDVLHFAIQYNPKIMLWYKYNALGWRHKLP